jgi:uncharacterized protein YdaU (DUF1376 family)
MAKDPAFLFYPNDYLGGTMGMTFEEKGAYIELLMLQFNRGHMSSHMAAQVVGQLWDKVRCKFDIDDNGLFYNKRLDEEIKKRKKYSLSRRNNLKGSNQYTNKETFNTLKSGHMTSHMENENENEDVNKDKSKIDKPKKEKFTPPSLDEVKQFFADNGYINADKAWNYYNDGNWKDSKGNQVLNWKQKMRVVWFKDENKKPTDQLKISMEDQYRRERERLIELNK